MRAVRTGFELWVSLRGYKPRMCRFFDHLYNVSVRGEAGEQHAVFRQHSTVIVVDLVAVTMTLMDCFITVEPICFGVLVQLTRIGAET